MATQLLSHPPSFLNRKLAWGIRPAHVLLLGIMLLSAILHFINLDSIGDANTYYTAAVKSMLQSWSNFFFVAAEPGGSVTVDKPPLGLWAEAAFALLLGVHGWVVCLPNMLAGIFSVPLLYHLVKKHLGALAGLVAALVLAVTPVAVATDRNNTMDGMLVFTLLLAAWAFVAATENGQSRWLFLGAFLLGLGFNIKMLQAFLPLPAFYALYILGAKSGWCKKLLSMGAAAVTLLVVSLSWAVVVDLTPTERRPYIGSSQDNTVMELIVGHNGLSRLFNPRAGKAPSPQMSAGPSVQPPPPQAVEACVGQSQNAPCSFTLPDGKVINGACLYPPGMNELACTPRGAAPQSGQPPAAPGGQTAQPRPGFNPPPGAMGDGPNVSPNPNTGGPQAPGGTPFNQETGSPGLERFFVAPLSKQMSWLLPFALMGLAMAVFAARLSLPLQAEHKAFVLWGGWLLTCLVFFSAVEGIFHAYYTIMLAPALGAAVGMGMTLFWRWQVQRPGVNAGLILAAALTVAFQIFAAARYGFASIVVYAPVVLLVLAAILLPVKFLRPAAYPLVLAAMTFIPSLWTGLTVLNEAPNVNLPTAFDRSSAPQPQRQPVPALSEPNPADNALVTFLQTNTQGVEYLAAVPNAHTGAPLVLATGRPVLYIGGFGGQDTVIDAAGLAEMVAQGRLRYVLFGNGPEKPDIAQWLASSCAIVPQFAQPLAPSTNKQPGSAAPPPLTLYQCP